MNKRKRITQGIIVLVGVAYLFIATFFALNAFSLSDSYADAEKKYAAEVERSMKDALDAYTDSTQFDQLIQEYPMELNVQDENGVIYQTVSETNLALLFGVVNRDAIVQEAQFTYPIDGKSLEVWYTLYRMPENYFLGDFLVKQMGLLLVAFGLAVLSIFLIQQSLYRPLKQVKSAIAKANEYEFDHINDAQDEVNKSFDEFTHKVENTIHAVSRKNTTLETELQRERERLKNTIMVARSLVHDLKTPVHQNLVENELELDKYIDVLSTKELAERNIEISDRILKNINETLAIMKEDIYQEVKDKTKVDIETLYLDTLRMYQGQMQKKQLMMDVSLEETEVICNKPSVQLLIHNLISNMVQYAINNTKLYIDVMIKDNKMILHHENKANTEDIERMKKTEQLFNVVQLEKSKTNVYSSGNGLFLIKDLAHLMDGSYELSIDGNTVIIDVILPIEV